MAAIDVDGVSKRFGDVVALQDLSLTVEEGEIYGFLGPNGAGKSTTINILLDFVRPDTGQARILGFDAQKDGQTLRQNVGVLPEGYKVYDRLTARQHLEFVMDSKDVRDDPERILERVGIPEATDRKAGGFSKGMAQRLVLGMALVGEPDLLILDEPTSGLDPNGAREMREIVREENERGATVFFSSHILGQVEAVCDRVGVLNDGRMIEQGTLDELRGQIGAGSTLEVTVDRVTDEVETAARSAPGVQNVDVKGSTLSLSVEEDTKMDALDAIRDTGATIQNMETREESLEDLFAELTEEESGTSTAEGEEVTAE